MIKSLEPLKEVYDRTRWDVFAMAVAHLLDIGFRTAREISDEDIERVEGNGLMTQEFAQYLVRTSRDIAVACEQPTSLLVFLDMEETFKQEDEDEDDYDEEE